MIKSTYLANTDVNEFVQWMSAKLDDGIFARSYKNRRTGEAWSCQSLSDAFTQYYWPHPAIPQLGVPAGATFTENEKVLAVLQKALHEALRPTPSDVKACNAAIAVMAWGGVRAGNVSWLRANQKGLAQLLIEISNALSAGDTTHPLLTSMTLRFNAGMTKVYSLICKDFIIYDSRVAAALCQAVVKFCDATGRMEIPMELRFLWAPAKEGKNQQEPKRRDPNERQFVFPQLRPGAPHAEWNIKASWLLRKTLDHAKAPNGFNKGDGPTDPLRALEAALFMIGYDLGAGAAPSSTTGGQGGRPGLSTSTSLEPADSDRWTECWTKKHDNPFFYRITERGISVKEGQTFSDADVNATLQRLWEDFGQTAFPLSNNRDNVPNGLAANGLGTAYFKATGKGAKNTSRLAAMLEELGVINRVVPSPARGMHWTLNTALLQLASPEASVNIRLVLDAAMVMQQET